MRLKYVLKIASLFTIFTSCFSYAILEGKNIQRAYENKDTPKDIPILLCKDFPICTEFPNLKVNKKNDK